MVTAKSFRELEIWKKDVELVKEIYTTTENFPSKETYGLVSQMRRAAVSIPSNIAEGFRRQHSKEFKQFLSITLGSLAELETQISIAKELGYLQPDNEGMLLEAIDHISRMTTNLAKKI